MNAKRSDVSEKYFSLGQSIAWIYGLTVGPFIVSSWLGYGPFCRPQTLHEFGDFLAGVFSPLAFLFFVISVLIQREEFRLTREEMESSRDELSKQVSQLKLSGISPILKESIENYYLIIENVIFPNQENFKNCVDGAADFFTEHFFADFQNHLQQDLEERYMKPEYSDFMEDVSEKFYDEVNKLKFSIEFREITNEIQGFIRVIDFFTELYFQANISPSPVFDRKSMSIFLKKEYCDAYEGAKYIINNWDSVLEAEKKYSEAQYRMSEIRKECEKKLGINDGTDDFNL